MSFQCPAGYICSQKMSSRVGDVGKVDPNKTSIGILGPMPSQGTQVNHITATQVTQGADNKVNGGKTVVYVEKNGTYQPAAVTKNGGKNYSFYDSEFPTMAGVASVDVQNGLNDENNTLGIRKNINQQTVSALERTKTISDEEIKKVVNSKKNTDKIPPTQDDSNTAEITDSTDADEIEGTKLEFAKDLQYPISLSETQDTIKIQMLKYEPRGLNTQRSRAGLGEETRSGEIRTKIGQVVLPIPGGIKDSDNVNWGSGDSMNFLEMKAANVAMTTMKGDLEGALNELKGTIGKKPAEGEIRKESAIEGIKAYFTAAAIGKDFKTIMQRQQGAVLNPNMELLFGGPTLRPFTFNFLLAPRSKIESEMVMKIIRFFKQGMAPIRTGGHLFLRSPHTFQLEYMNGKETHKYLNSFKECALKTCEVNYTPEQTYSTYEDGVMTAYTMSLQFQELEPVYNDDYGDEKNVANLNFID